ncbi:hypothetical protein M378DRAFT_1038874 [Amanita muscaria Koide BX008]|uniref:Uncharacterized protein n=1 Tax=Amanita muscaria (strain Koide BX008) TaxID=946122 RepID=A0A0C2S0N1_AMAMK|nr:hypothetical protein M378DRAFT_1038874 [Amanita muscaria Koide BX008]
MPPSQEPASNATNTNKRKKTSGLTGLELRMAYQSLISVKSLLKTVTATNEVDASDDLQSQENLITFEPDFEETLAKMLEMMKSKLDGPQALSFSGMTEEALSKLNITLGGSLKLKTDYKVRVAATEELGMTEHWSSEGLYRHLRVLQKLNEAASRAWIDSFFFRASAMMPQGKQLVLSLEQSVPLPATTVKPFGFSTIRGYIDYTAIGVSASGAGKFLRQPLFAWLIFCRKIFGLATSGAKASNISLENHVPQAVCKMYAYAKQLGKNIIRGAVTDGHNWIFLVLKMDPNGDGAIYAQSLQRTRLMTVVPPGDEEISRTMCDVIAGIIGYWVSASSVSLPLFKTFVSGMVTDRA